MRQHKLIAALACLLLFAAACGDDDDSGDDAAAKGDTEEICDARDSRFRKLVRRSGLAKLPSFVIFECRIDEWVS